MKLRRQIVVFDAADLPAESSFWAGLLGAEVKYYDAKGMRTRAIEAGSGEPLIFLHGSGGHAEAYCRNVVPLSDEFIDRSSITSSAKEAR